MFKHQYKEKTYAEEILKDGFTSNHVSYELKILVKYYKDLGYKPKQRKEKIYKFCEENLEGYDRVLHFKMINSALNYGANKKNKLIEIEVVNVSEQELTCIHSLEISHDYKKILFTLLVLDKLNKRYFEIRNEEKAKDEYYFGGDGNYKNLISSSKVTLKRSQNIHSIIGDLAKQGILETIGKGNIKLSFMYDINKDDDVALSITSYDNIGYYYDLYLGVNKVKACECCKIPIKVRSNRSKYCDNCFKENRSEYQKELMRKRRNSSNK